MKDLASILWIVGMVMLFWVDWRIGLGVFLVVGSNNVIKRLQQ